MRQRVAIARALAIDAPTMLMDEPFGALDPMIRRHLQELLLNLWEGSCCKTAVFVTHDIDEAILLSDRIYLLTGQPGRIADEIVIKEPKPRCGDFNLTTEFLEYKKEILEKLASFS
jgi:ABC-type nitrate/sulfonate/bicarbonate transport system ATPase subunit